MRTENKKENAKRNTVANRTGAVSIPPSVKPRVQIAAETGCSLLSTHMGQWGKGYVEPTDQSKWDPPIYHHDSVGLFLSNLELRPKD